MISQKRRSWFFRSSGRRSFRLRLLLRNLRHWSRYATFSMGRVTYDAQLPALHIVNASVKSGEAPSGAARRPGYSAVNARSSLIASYVALVGAASKAP